MEPLRKKARLDNPDGGDVRQDDPNPEKTESIASNTRGTVVIGPPLQSNLNEKHKIDRIEGLRCRIQPFWAPKRFLKDLLVHHDWDVEKAYQSWKSLRNLPDVLDENAYDEDSGDDAASLKDENEETSSSQKTFSNGDQKPALGKPETSGRFSNDNQLPALPATFKGLPITYHNQGEHERRQVVELFAALVNKKEDTGSDVHLSKTEAVLLLTIYDWDVQKALKEFGNHIEALDLLEERFETSQNWRSQLTHARDSKGAKRSLREQQVQRIALLVTITARPDWYSHEVFLSARNWDFVKAVHDWMSEGIPVTKHKHDTKNKEGKKRKFWGFGRRRHPITLNPLPYPHDQDVIPLLSTFEWAPERKTFGVEYDSEFEDDLKDIASKSVLADAFENATESGGSEDEENAEDEVDGNTGRKRFKAAIINDDHGKIIHAGVSDPGKFVFEYFSQKSQIINVFMSHRYFWPEREEEEDVKTDKPTFDFNNINHVSDLNKWRQQNRTRATGLKKRGPNQEYTEAEKDFIYGLWQHELDVLKKAHPELGDDELKQRLRISNKKKEEWAEKFNKAFEGEDMDDGQGTRRARKGTAIMTASHRTKKICDDFGLGFDKNLKETA